jgi:NAD(P)-dependent dehydrogenase (short-subunit alcohol dehydrogenase family)
VKESLSGKYAADALVLPLDMTGPQAELESAAKAANEAFGGAGVDFLVHNAGGRAAGAARLSSGPGIAGGASGRRSGRAQAPRPCCRRSRARSRARPAPPHALQARKPAGRPPQPFSAGASHHARAVTTAPEVYSSLMNLNALGPMALTRAALPFMLARRRWALACGRGRAAQGPPPRA